MTSCALVLSLMLKRLSACYACHVRVKDVYNPVYGKLYVRYDLVRLRQSQLQQRMLFSSGPEMSSNSFSSACFSHTNTQFLSSHLSAPLLSLHPHLPMRQHTPLTAPRASSTWALMKYKSGAIKETCRCVFVDILYVMSIRPVPQDYYLVALQRSQIRLDDLFRMCTVLGIIIFCEIIKSIKAVSCPQAEILVVFWMHVLCPVNMICGLLL